MGAKKQKRGTKSARGTGAAAAYCHPEGMLSIVGGDGVDNELHIAPDQPDVVDEAIETVGDLLQQGYTFLLADQQGAHVRVQGFDKRRSAYLVPGADDVSIAVPVAEARAIALPRQVGG